MVKEEHRDILDQRWAWEVRRKLRVSPERTDVFLRAAQDVGAGLVIVDSAKDTVSKISTDEHGQAFNDAVQTLVVNEIAVIVIHHPRKSVGGERRSSLTLDDVYGSAWLTAGAGSVIALLGEPGSGVAKFSHLKQPAQEVGPFEITFDYGTGEVKTIGRRSILDYLDNHSTATTTDLARWVTGKERPTAAEKKKVLRRADSMAIAGDLLKTVSGPGEATIWSLLAPHQINPPDGSQPGQGLDKPPGNQPDEGGQDAENTRSAGVTQTSHNLDTEVGQFPPINMGGTSNSLEEDPRITLYPTSNEPEYEDLVEEPANTLYDLPDPL